MKSDLQRDAILLNAEEKAISLEEFINAIFFEVWENGTEFLKVTHDFSKSGKRVFLIRFPEVEEDDDMIFFNDADAVIESNSLVLFGFLKSSVKMVSKFKSEETDMDCYKLYFNDGHVIIEPIQD